MFVYLLQLREAALGHMGALVLFPIYATLVWINWGIRAGVSRRYRPWTETHDITATVIVPVVDEPVDLFFDVLQRIQKQSPHEAIVVINGPRNTDLEEVSIEVTTHLSRNHFCITATGEVGHEGPAAFPAPLRFCCARCEAEAGAETCQHRTGKRVSSRHFCVLWHCRFQRVAMQNRRPTCGRQVLGSRRSAGREPRTNSSLGCRA